METELKYRVTGKVKPSKIEELDWSPYVLGPRERHPLRDVVLDTPDRVITGRMHALRLRHDGSVVYLTLKGPGAGEDGARHNREELEEAIAPTAVDDRTLWPEAIRARVDGLVGEQQVGPILEIHNKRRTWLVRREDHVVAEIALDRGEIRAGPHAQPLHEIEIERKGDGTEEDLQALAEHIRRELPLAPEHRTKLERGLALLDGEGDAQMHPYASVAEAGRTILQEHWKRLHKNEPGVRKGEDPEAVHDMRVSTRRLRAMLEVLGGTAYDRKVTDTLRKGLKRLARCLGVVRDAEVWMLAVEEYAEKLEPGNRAGIDPLLRELHRRRDAGRDALLAELDHARTAKLFARVKRFVTTPGAGVLAASRPVELGSLRVRDVAGSAIWARLEEVHAFNKAVSGASVTLLHELRIACKHLRYTLDLFSDALGSDAKELREQLVAVQDHLGELHDADVALPFIDHMLEVEPQNEALQNYRRHLAAERERLLGSIDSVWGPIGGGEFRGRLAAIIAGL